MCHDHLEYYLESAMWDNSCVCATWHISLPVSLAGSNYAQIRGTDFDYYFKVNVAILTRNVSSQKRILPLDWPLLFHPGQMLWCNVRTSFVHAIKWLFFIFLFCYICVMSLFIMDYNRTCQVCRVETYWLNNRIGQQAVDDASWT